MKTSLQWWQSICHDEQALIVWLEKQFYGETMAASRLLDFLAQYRDQASDPKWVETVEHIAQQEAQHAQWIGQLLVERGVTPEIQPREERYWDKTLEHIDSWETGCAVAAHAERMRLERIEVIVNDEQAPEDIREVFARILPEERFHEKAFAHFTTDEALTKTLHQHEAGATALGLVF